MRTILNNIIQRGFNLLLFLPTLLSAQYFETDFESILVNEPYTRDVWTADDFTPNNWDNALEARTSVDTVHYVSGLKSLKVTFPQGQYGNSLANGTGTQVELLLPAKDEYFMSYFLRFSENFSWGTTSEGGKLPGLTNRNRCGSDFICDGTDGFSARFMWRANGKGVLYLYHMDMPAQYGEDFAFKNPDETDFLFEKGKWYHLAERVKINSGANNYDGIVTVWVNGIEVLHLNNIRFQSNGDQVDNFFFSTFHGGNSAAWAPTTTCYLWFDDLKIATSLSDVAYQNCTNPDAESFGENCILSFIDQQENTTFKIHPNPTTRWLHLPQSTPYTILSLEGQTMCAGVGKEIDLTDLTHGLYLLQIGTQRYKIVKQ